MDFSSFLPNIESLAMLYGWTLFAAVMFALGERIVARVRAQRAQAPDRAGRGFKDSSS
jgi:hypothetical protein